MLNLESCRSVQQNYGVSYSFPHKKIEVGPCLDFIKRIKRNEKKIIEGFQYSIFIITDSRPNKFVNHRRQQICKI